MLQDMIFTLKMVLEGALLVENGMILVLQLESRKKRSRYKRYRVSEISLTCSRSVGDKQDFDQRSFFFRASIYVRVIGELEQYNGRNYLNNITNIRKDSRLSRILLFIFSTP